MCLLEVPSTAIDSVICFVGTAPPGGTINVSGHNFSANAVEDKVFFGEVPLKLRFASPSQLTVVVPNWSWGPSQLKLPISVEVDGIRSAK